MKNEKVVSVVSIICVFFLLTTSCSSSNEIPTPTPTVEKPPTVIPTHTPTIAPTDTPAPTSTIQPTVDIFVEELNTWFLEYSEYYLEYSKAINQFGQLIVQFSEDNKLMGNSEFQESLKISMGSMVDNASILKISDCPDSELNEALNNLYEDTMAVSINFNTFWETVELDYFETALHSTVNTFEQYRITTNLIKEQFNE